MQQRKQTDIKEYGGKIHRKRKLELRIFKSLVYALYI